MVLYNYWGMDNDADVKWRMWHLNNWKDMLVDELHDGRPILYSAGGAEIGDDWVYGHSWVIDGVTVDHNYFWCNWGWYGDYNGWYELGNFKPDDDNYNQMESAIFDVYPVEPGGVATPQLSNQTFTYSSNGYNLTIPDALGATSYEWITSHGTITGTGTSVTLHTDCSATVQVRAYNEICDIYSSYDAANITINYGPISVSDLICYSSTTASIQNVPNTTITWGGTNVAYPSGNTGTTVIVRAAGSTTSNTGTITASFTIDDTPYTVSETVWVGAPKIDYVSGPTYTPNFQWATYYAQPNNYLMAATDYEWILNPLNGNSVYDYGWTADIAFYNSGYYQVVVRAQNTCGWGSYAVLGVEVYDSKSLAISPNPSNGEITLAIESTDEKEFLTGEEWDFEISEILTPP